MVVGDKRGMGMGMIVWEQSLIIGDGDGIVHTPRPTVHGSTVGMERDGRRGDKVIMDGLDR